MKTLNEVMEGFSGGEYLLGLSVGLSMAFLFYTHDGKIAKGEVIKISNEIYKCKVVK